MLLNIFDLKVLLLQYILIRSDSTMIFVSKSKRFSVTVGCVEVWD